MCVYVSRGRGGDAVEEQSRLAEALVNKSRSWLLSVSKRSCLEDLITEDYKTAKGEVKEKAMKRHRKPRGQYVSGGSRIKANGSSRQNGREALSARGTKKKRN